MQQSVAGLACFSHHMPFSLLNLLHPPPRNIVKLNSSVEFCLYQEDGSYGRERSLESMNVNEGSARNVQEECRSVQRSQCIGWFSARKAELGESCLARSRCGLSMEVRRPVIAGVASQLGSEECGQLLFSGCKVSVMPDDKVLDICFQYCTVHLLGGQSSCSVFFYRNFLKGEKKKVLDIFLQAVICADIETKILRTG